MTDGRSLEIKKTRNVFLDVLKGVAIILVVLGHSIQYGSGAEYLENNCFFDNAVYKMIYGFHMPLFMLISGYLFHHSIEKYSFSKNVKSRFMTLMLPIFCWAVVSYIISFLDGTLMVEYPFRAFYYIFIFTLWFLGAIFVCSFIVLIVNRFLRDSRIVYLCLFILAFVTPDGLVCKMYKFMYPFFVAGYFFAKDKGNLKQKKWMKQEMLLPIFTILYLVLLLFYRRESYIYNSPYCIIQDNPLAYLVNDLYRMCIGFVGSVSIILIVKLIYSKTNEDIAVNKCLTYIGKNSLGIYSVSTYLFSYLIPAVTRSLSELNYIIVCVISCVVIVCSLMVTELLKKVKLLNVLFLGGRK